MKFRAILDSEEDKAERKKFSVKPWMITALFVLMWAAVLAFLAIIYTAKSRYIYFWDNATYWDISRDIASGKISGGFWKNVYDSIGTMDYNYVAGLLSALIAYIFGGSRMVYTAGLAVMYLAPSVLMMYFLAKKIGTMPKITASAIMFMCPVLTHLAFLGFVDVGSVIIALMCYNLYFTKDEEKQSIKKSILIGVLLVLMMIWRRYWAFFAVSFLTAMIGDCILFKKKWYCILITAAVAAAVVLLFFRGFLTNILLSDYGSLYSDYKFSPAIDFKLITRYFGALMLLALAAGSVYIGVKHKEYRVVAPWIQIVSCAGMFMATQTHGQQHLLLYIPSLAVIITLIIKYAEEKWMKIVIFALAALSTANIFVPRIQPDNIQDINHYALICDYSARPRTRDDVWQVLSLKRSLDDIVPKDSKMGVLSSSFSLNEDVLKNAEASLGVEERGTDYIKAIPQVDSRDTDLSPLYEMDYILAAYPAQTHLAAQSIIKEAADSFEKHTDFAAAFTENPEFETYIGGITVKLYRKERDVTEVEKKQFEARLRK